MPFATDWIALAKARGLEMPDAERERIVEPLRALERRFRPLALKLSPDILPAVIFHADPERGE